MSQLSHPRGGVSAISYLLPQSSCDSPTDLALVEDPEGVRMAVSFGLPLREPVVPWGPFVGTSRGEVAAYGQAYQAGAMGRLEPYFSR